MEDDGTATVALAIEEHTLRKCVYDVTGVLPSEHKEASHLALLKISTLGLAESLRDRCGMERHSLAIEQPDVFAILQHTVFDAAQKRAVTSLWEVWRGRADFEMPWLHERALTKPLRIFTLGIGFSDTNHDPTPYHRSL